MRLFSAVIKAAQRRIPNGVSRYGFYLDVIAHAGDHDWTEQAADCRGIDDVFDQVLDEHVKPAPPPENDESGTTFDENYENVGIDDETAASLYPAYYYSVD
jgi:hypothetical protein